MNKKFVCLFVCCEHYLLCYLLDCHVACFQFSLMFDLNIKSVCDLFLMPDSVVLFTDLQMTSLDHLS